MSIRFLHAADLHLDSPLRGLERYEGAPVDRIRGASRHALENLVKLAIDEKVQFVVLAGDIYDGDWPDVGTGLFFVQQMARLNDAGIPVAMIAGNHDAANKMSRKLPFAGNVHVLSHERPATLHWDHLGVALHGQSYAQPNETNNLAITYPSAVKGLFNIGILHTALTGRDGHEPYAPCIREDLESRGYDYWALGHIHQRESVNETRRPRIEFPGNIQGRHIRETGAKGCLLVTANGNAIATEFRALDVVRWARVVVSCDGAENRDDILQRAADGLDAALAESADRMLAIRVDVKGECAFHDSLAARPETLQDEIRALAINRRAGTFWIEKVEVLTHPPRRREPMSDDALCEFAAVAQSLADEPGQLQTLLEMDEITALAAKIPTELIDADWPLRLDDPVWARELLDRARALLVEEAAR